MRSLAHLLGAQSPIVGVGLSMVAMLYIIMRVADAVVFAARFNVDAEAVVARALADEMAYRLTDRLTAQSAAAAPRFPEVRRDRYLGRAVCEPGGPRTRMAIEVRTPRGRTYEYRCEVLPGAGPAPLSNRLSIAAPEPSSPGPRWSWLRQEHLPTPVWVGALPATEEPLPGFDLQRGAEATGFVPDESIALLRLPAGTDRPDYVLVRAAGCVHELQVPSSAVLHVAGNLWLGSPDQVVVLELRTPLTVIVLGNVYLSGSVRVRGGGRLVLVARGVAGEDGFLDLDFDGRFSSGDHMVSRTGNGHGNLEGSGAVYFGLPGENPPPDRIVLDADLVAFGEIYLRARRSEVRGALVVGQGLSAEDDSRFLSLPPARLPSSHRQTVAGFVAVGTPRPSLLEDRK